MYACLTCMMTFRFSFAKPTLCTNITMSFFNFVTDKVDHYFALTPRCYAILKVFFYVICFIV